MASLIVFQEMIMLEKQPTTPTLNLNPVILPGTEVSKGFIIKPEQHHTPPPVLQPIKDSATEEKEVGVMMSCDPM